MIELTYGRAQRFRFRCGDITILGRVTAPLPLRRSEWRLNAGRPVAFYVEHVAGAGVDWRFAYKPSPSRLMLKDLGDFRVEIPVGLAGLRAGDNQVRIEVEDRDGRVEACEMAFTWDPSPVPLPLDLADVARFESIQEVGQVLVGAFDLDRRANMIRSRAPVAPDALLVLGSSHSSQEATYDVRFSDLAGAKYLGLSDFFVAHEPEDPPIGIKTGWSTAGLATLAWGWRPGSPGEVDPDRPAEPNPRGEARAWLAYADNSRQSRRWLVKTDPPARVDLAPGVTYRVRHQVVFRDGVNRVRFRLWPAGQPEPARWLCDIADRSVAPDRPRFTRASFALFQHTGSATEWSNIRVAALGPDG
jgi:hypothetical protein